jgi:hypothetical protein
VSIDMKNIDTAAMLKNKIECLFPGFVAEWDENGFNQGDRESLSFHRVWMTFAPIAYEACQQHQQVK